MDDKTLTAALKFLGLLWRDKVHEELIESVNPLSQIEVSFPNAHGGNETSLPGLLVPTRTRADDTRRFHARRGRRCHRSCPARARARERQGRQRLPSSLACCSCCAPIRTSCAAFLEAADVALRKSNALLTAPGIEQEDLRKKLNGVFRELHAVKGEAAALALTLFVQRIHQIEDTLSAIAHQASSSGNDFLPVVVQTR